MSEAKFMLLVWDLTFYGYNTDAVSCSQYENLSDLFRSVWDICQYNYPSATAHGA